jgi:hypothetical protein
MRRFPLLVVLALAAAATGCIYEREVVRDDPRAESPPPPADAPAYTYDSSYDRYQADAPPPPPGSDVSSEAVFYERLSPYGYWTFVAPYGRVWVPSVGYGWRPYYYGRWVLTDWGWTFASDDPWGWAAYHYGRWNWGVGLGWYWIPGSVWAPAWVNWRYGAGFVTWCPLGPPGVVFAYRHPAWVAVPERHFTRPIAAVAVPARRTVGVVAQARPLSGAQATAARGGSFGPPVAAVARATGQSIRPVAAAQVVRPRPTVRAGSPAATGMRSPQPRVRAGSGRETARPVPTSRPGQGPRATPNGRPSGGPRIESGPPRGSGGGPTPRASPPSGGGGSGPRAVAPSGGGGRPQARLQ